MKVWDVATQQCRHTLRHHSGKVQAVAWNPAEAPVLLTGAFDKQACLVRVILAVVAGSRTTCTTCNRYAAATCSRARVWGWD